MLKQKFLKFKEYKKLSKQLKVLKAQQSTSFENFAVAYGKISVLKTNKLLPHAKPNANFWGFKDYPCIIYHQGNEFVRGLALLAGKSDTITFVCPNYSSYKVCSNEHCAHRTNNQHCFDAREKLVEDSRKYNETKKQYDSIRQQLFGVRRKTKEVQL